MNSKNVLIIEDDKIQADELKRRLEQAGFKVRHISTELQFQKFVKEPGVATYDIAVVDMMLRWTDPSPEMEMPSDEILAEGFYVAGLRCSRTLKQHGVRALIFTALDPARVPLAKGEDFPVINKSRGYDALIEILQSQTKPRSS